MSEALLRRFYDAFAARDGEAMAACYADDVVFSDPAFPDLRGAEAGDMWRMLTGRAADLRIEYRVEHADATRGQVHWEAWYTFSQTGRKVHNVIDATLELRDDRIVRHTDRFDFHRWSKQALGPAGLLLGWTTWMQRKVQAKAGEGLRQFRAGRGR